jgi:hypothetical protein
MSALAATGSTVLDEIAEAIGVSATIALARNFGGRRIYVPRELGGAHPIVSAIGADAARLLADHFHGTELQLPIRLRREAIIRALDARDPRPSNAEIANLAGVTERTVYNVLARPVESPPGSRPRDTRQIDMFEV